MTARSPRRAGFTLIEIMLVVVIIGLLAAVAIPKIGGKLDTAQINTTRGTIKVLDSAINSFMLDHSGKLPGALAEVVPYLQNAKGIPKDSYGNDFVYTPNSSDSSWSIASPGKDGTLGSTDDITN